MPVASDHCFREVLLCDGAIAYAMTGGTAEVTVVLWLSCPGGSLRSDSWRSLGRNGGLAYGRALTDDWPRVANGGHGLIVVDLLRVGVLLRVMDVRDEGSGELCHGREQLAHRLLALGT